MPVGVVPGGIVCPPPPFVGVGKNPRAISDMGRANDGRWYAIPFRIIPERGQRSENVSKPSTKQLCDVLQQNELWSKFANQTGDLRKETGTLTGKSEAASRDADRKSTRLNSSH